jgi:hypothetical protein
MSFDGQNLKNFDKVHFIHLFYRPCFWFYIKKPFFCPRLKGLPVLFSFRSYIVLDFIFWVSDFDLVFIYHMEYGMEFIYLHV